MLMQVLHLSLEMNLYQTIHHSLRCCLHCGSFQCRPSLFCSSCEAQLWRRHSGIQQFELGRRKTKGLALFDWYPNEDRMVSKLIIAMKGGRLTETFEFYANTMCGHLQVKLPRNSVLVPCPSNGRRKHAQVLAQAFSRTLQVPIVDSLVKVGEGDQKTRNLLERSHVEIQNCRDFSQQHVIFIDDIVTTGATALSARNAIGSCLGYEVWCLAHRRQLATLLSF